MMHEDPFGSVVAGCDEESRPEDSVEFEDVLADNVV